MTAASDLGRLLVERPSVLGTRETTLDRVPVGVPVTTTAKIVNIHTLRGRVCLTLDDGRGGSAFAVVESGRLVKAFQAAGVRPQPGVCVQIRGVVTPPVAKMTKTIEANVLRVVS
ncbi:hypothetical protein [Streptomyces lydicamycinicus]|uniref:hypothetical protein n=1 Tax=Streptomyces lydicamycinicus TaxID=1546107 RepID=UPI003C2CF69B